LKNLEVYAEVENFKRIHFNPITLRFDKCLELVAGIWTKATVDLEEIGLQDGR
jgi:hypothetical protein